MTYTEAMKTTSSKNATSESYLCFHTHWDREWYEPFRVYQLRLVAMLEQVLNALEDGLIDGFCLDGQTVILEDAFSLNPKLEKQLQPWFERKALHVGPWYTAPDTGLTSLESLIRNLQRGIKQSKPFGCRKFTGYLPDTFGHSEALPMLFQQCGIETAIIWRGRRLKASPWLAWQSPNGAEVLTHQLPEGYFQFQLHDVERSTEEQIRDFKELVTRLNIWPGPSLIPVGGDHLGLPSETSLKALQNVLKTDETLSHLQKKEGCLATQPYDFMKKALQRYNTKSLDSEVTTRKGALRDWGSDEINGDTPFLLPGANTARLWLKQRNSQLEHRLTQETEPLLALLASNKLTLPTATAETIEEAWRLLLLNHAHDSIGGCSIDSVHRADETRFDEVEALADGLQRWSTQRVKQALKPGQAPWGINLSTYERQGVVAINALSPDKEPAQFESTLVQTVRESTKLKPDYQTDLTDVPLSNRLVQQTTGWAYLATPLAAGTASTVVLAEQLDTKQHVIASEAILENALLQVQLGMNGTLTILDKRTSTTQTSIHQLALLQELGDSYNQVPQPEEPIEYGTLQKVSVTQAGPLVGQWQLTYQLGEETLQTLVTLKANEATLDFDTTWQHHTPNTLIQVGFQAKHPIDTLWVKSHVGPVEEAVTPRTDRFGGLSDRLSPAGEWCPQGGLFQDWLAFEQQAIFTDGLPVYELNNDRLWLTLHRGFGLLSGGTLPTRGLPAGPPFETPEGQGLYRQRQCRYAWRPTTAAVESSTEQLTLQKAVDHWLNPLTVHCDQRPQIETSTASVPRIALPIWIQRLQQTGLQRSACLLDTQGRLVTRWLNASNQGINLPESLSAACEAINLLEEVQGWPDLLEPYGLLTLREKPLS